MVEGESEEHLPVSERVKVLRSQTLFKSGAGGLLLGSLRLSEGNISLYTFGLGVETFGGEGKSSSSEAKKSGLRQEKP